jgi:hypothetical protein
MVDRVNHPVATTPLAAQQSEIEGPYTMNLTVWIYGNSPSTTVILLGWVFPRGGAAEAGCSPLAPLRSRIILFRQVRIVSMSANVEKSSSFTSSFQKL